MLLSCEGSRNNRKGGHKRCFETTFVGALAVTVTCVGTGDVSAGGEV